MEEKPPTQAGRDADRSRTPRAPFHPPEQSAPQDKPAERSARRSPKPAPPVTFQPPAADSTDDTRPTAPPRSGGSAESRRKPGPRKGANPRPGRPSPAQTSNGSTEVTPPSADQAAPAAKATPAKATGSRRRSPATPKGAPPEVGETASAQSPADTGSTTPADSPAPTNPGDAPAQPAARTSSPGQHPPRPAGGTPVKAAPTADTDAATTATPQAAPANADGPVKATPPRPEEGIAGDPTPSESSQAHVQESLIPDQTSKRAKATPAKKAARKTTRPTPARPQPTATTAPAGTTSAQPTATTPAETKPAETKPAETKPAESKAPATTPTAVSTARGEARPAEIKPMQAKPADTETAEAKPARTQPAEAKPAETQPAEAKPLQTQPATAEEGQDRTGAEPIPPADPQPSKEEPPAEDDKRTGADPIPPAEDQAKPTGIVATVQPSAAAEVAAQPGRTEPWAQLVADPGHAPELLALAAVQTLGPRASLWATRLREAYPNASDDALARLAVQQFTRFGSVGSVFAAVAGSYAPITLLGSNALTYAEIVLHVAAAYGQDPTDRERAVDLLVLAQVHPSREDAEAALATAEQPAYEEETRLTDAVWRLGRMVAAQAGVWAVLKGLNRFFPGTAMLAAIMTSRSGARNMGAKATAFYRARPQSQSSHSSGSSV